MLYIRLKHKIRNAAKMTKKEFSKKNPIIQDYLFYGSFDISPDKFVIWYLFETDEELKAAESTGLCSEITNATIRNLISSGYPISDYDLNKKTLVSFTTYEDIDKKADGDIHLYFQ